MQEILALHDIKTVVFTDNAGVEHLFAFTPEMATNNIFIEYSNTEEADEDTQEEMEENDIEPRYGSELSVSMEYQGEYYLFTLYHESYEIAVPVMLVQTILFLKDLIARMAPTKLITALSSLSPDPLIPHTIDDEEFREAAEMLIKLKIQTAQELIQQGKAGMN